MSSTPVGIGSRLRAAREDQDLSIEETAWRTRMRPELLRAIESEDFGDVEHRSSVRTHLASYARFLGMDPVELMAAFESGVGDAAPSSIEELDRQTRESKKPPRPKWVAAAVVSAVLLAAGASLGILGGQDERPAAPNDRASVAPLPTIPSTVSAAEARVRLRVTASSDTSISITADGRQVFDAVLVAGKERTFRAADELEIVSSDGGTITLRFNGENLGPAGIEGEVFRARFGPSGRLD